MYRGYPKHKGGLLGCVSFSSGRSVDRHIRIHDSVCRGGWGLGDGSGRGGGSAPGACVKAVLMI